MFFDQVETLFRMAIAAFALVMVVTKGVQRLLLWMDEKDWIVIPNSEAVRNADRAQLRALLEAQAVVEPAKKHAIERKVREEDERAEDEEGEGGRTGPEHEEAK